MQVQIQNPIFAEKRDKFEEPSINMAFIKNHSSNKKNENFTISMLASENDLQEDKLHRITNTERTCILDLKKSK